MAGPQSFLRGKEPRTPPCITNPTEKVEEVTLRAGAVVQVFWSTGKSDDHEVGHLLSFGDGARISPSERSELIQGDGPHGAQVDDAS